MNHSSLGTQGFLLHRRQAMESSALREDCELRRAYGPVSQTRYGELVSQSHLKHRGDAYQPQEMPLHENHPLKVQADGLNRMRFARAWLKAPL